MEVRLYRDINHPEMQMEIRLALEEAGLDLHFMEIVTGLMRAYGWQVAQAISYVQAALRTT